MTKESFLQRIGDECEEGIKLAHEIDELLGQASLMSAIVAVSKIAGKAIACAPDERRDTVRDCITGMIRHYEQWELTLGHDGPTH